MSGRENAWQGTPAEERSGSKSGSITAKECKDVGAAWWEYAIIAAVIALILWRNSFHELFLPDFSPARDAYLMKSLELSSYSSLVGFQSLMQAARIAGISAVAVQLVLAAGMCAAYIYLRKLLKKRSLAVMAFVIFAFNPFVYSRFMAGQFGVIIAYLLIPSWRRAR
jgi:hypothetical protein